jgi:hypothetical protein
MGRKHGVGWTIVLFACMVPPFFTIRAEEKPSVSLKFGASERLRNEFYNNITDMNKDKDDRTDYYRIRTSVWGQVSFAQVATFYTKFTNEFRKYTDDPKARDFTWDEIVFDNLYLKLETKKKDIGLTLGRQNLTYGEGFILMDGAPWDGSRTIYHDAVKLSVTRGKTTFDFIGIDNTKIEDHLSVIRGSKLKNGEIKGQPKNQMMNDGEEKALGLYITSAAVAKTKLDAYIIRKTEKPDPWNNLGASKEDLNLNTLGARINYAFSNRFSMTTEWAVESGTQGSIDHGAFGGYGYLSYVLCPQKKAAISYGVIALSGDDAATPGKNEGWNPLFSRWPKWSELYIYSYLNESNRNSVRVAYWTNLFSPYASYTMQVSKKVSLIANLYYLKALQDRMLTADAKSGLARGKEAQCWVKFVFNKYITGHLLYDYLFPGDFYAEPRTGGQFVRGELMFTI